MAEPRKRAAKKAGRPTKAARAKKAAPRRARGAALPGVVFAQASPRSLGGVSLFDTTRSVDAASVPAFASDEGLTRTAASRLQAAGFEVLQISPVTINIAGPPSLYEEVFNTRLVTEERPVIKPGARADTATFIDSPDTDLRGLVATEGTPFGDVLEGVAIEEPVYFMQNAFAPTKAYWHLDVPGDVSAGCDADQAHRTGITGRGVKAVMVDSGWFRHPYFARRGYRASPVVLGPAATNPNDDESGHGTGESANMFAVAPDIDFTMVKINFVNSTGAFNAAVALQPHIISNSWGSSVQTGPLSAANQALAAAIAVAAAQGIIVVFSAGNGHFGFPGQHPDVISAGGVFMDDTGNLEASSYASGFASGVYPGRNVPDLSGLVGMSPGASYIMLPVQPSDQIDTSRAGGTWPPQDETAANDGWAAFSGTSAAAPMLAGAAALVRQACPRLTPAEVRQILMATATDVTAGTNALGQTATAGYDLATGAGLVDAYRAVVRARLICRPIIPPPPVLPPVRPPVVVTPPIQPPVRPPVVITPPIQPPVRPPVVIAPPIQPPPVGPVVLPPPAQVAPSQQAEAVAVAEQLAAAGWSQEQIDAWFAQQVAAQQEVTPVTEEEAAALEAAILESGTDLGL